MGRTTIIGCPNLLIAIVLCTVVSSQANPSSNGNEIEARRRSVLDKNFMRFGRSNYDPAQVFLKEEANKQYGRELAKRNNNFLRFGRNDRLFKLLPNYKNDDEELPMMNMIERPQVRSSNSFLRLGRAMVLPLKAQPKMFGEDLEAETDLDADF